MFCTSETDPAKPSKALNEAAIHVLMFFLKSTNELRGDGGLCESSQTCNAGGWRWQHSALIHPRN